MPTKKLVIRREWKLASALMPYWMITRVSKAEFMKKYELEDDTSCGMTAWGQPVPRMDFCPREWGVPVGNGRTLELEMEDGISSVFAVTPDGLLSNEIMLSCWIPANPFIGSW